MHGVFMDILGLGVLITGESGLGKSELGLELISRGNGLVADDAVDLYRINQTTIEGRCPELLQNLLEVRGIGLLDIRAIFGETAVRRKMRLKLIVHLVRRETLEREYERMPYEPLTQDVLGIPVLKVVIQVVAGRNIAVLVEAAVRNTILQLRGIDTYQEFVERHRRAMGATALTPSGALSRRASSGPLGSATRSGRWGRIGLFRAMAYRLRAWSAMAKPLALATELLALFDLGVVELFHLAAVQAHQVVVVLPFVELVHRLAALEMCCGSECRPAQTASAPGTPWPVRCPSVHPAARGTRLRPSCGAADARWKISRIFRRGSVAFSPVLLSSSMLVMAKAEIVQGTVVAREQVQALQPGMPRQQVRDILGSPSVTSLFHDSRWEYVFTPQAPGDGARSLS
jgi:hypothetical protein